MLRLTIIAALIFSTIAAAAPKPNILFILTEDQGAQAGFLGTPGIRTPHMDRLAKSGKVFPNAFVVYPVCSASKAAIFTGLHNHANGLVNNTMNFHKPAAQLTAAERANPTYAKNRIRETIPTLTERLHAAGYYQAAMHKLHLSPNEKFPYDEFLGHPGGPAMDAFLTRAAKAGKPWFLLYNIPNSHRPYPNSDKGRIRIDAAAVKLPAFLPDTPVVRQDWAEYLAGIGQADDLIGQALASLKASGQQENTIIILLGDHGPSFQHGKMSLYDLGLRVPLVIAGPGVKPGRSDALVSELDLMPTLLDLLESKPPAESHGISLRPLLEDKPGAKGHDFIAAEISHRGPLPNKGLQERAIFDGRWKILYRENTEPAWRQVNEDLKDRKPWGNRTYDETIRVKEQFHEAWRVLSEMDPQRLGGKLSRIELYDLQSDPDEMRNLARDPAHAAQLRRLYDILRTWARDTKDPGIQPPAKLPE